MRLRSVVQPASPIRVRHDTARHARWSLRVAGGEPAGGNMSETVTVSSPKVLYIEDPSELSSLAPPPGSGEEAGTAPPRVAGSGRGHVLGSAPLRSQGLERISRRGANAPGGVPLPSAGAGDRRSSVDEEIEIAGQIPKLLDQFLDTLCAQLLISRPAFLKQCAQEAFVFVGSDRIRKVLDGMGEAAISTEEGLVMLDGSRFPIDLGDDSKEWSILAGRIASDCIQYDAHTHAAARSRLPRSIHPPGVNSCLPVLSVAVMCVDTQVQDHHDQASVGYVPLVRWAEPRYQLSSGADDALLE